MTRVGLGLAVTFRLVLVAAPLFFVACGSVAAQDAPLRLSGEICPHARVDCDHAGTPDDPYILRDLRIEGESGPAVACDGGAYMLALCDLSASLRIEGIEIVSLSDGIYTNSDVFLSGNLTAPGVSLRIAGGNVRATLDITQGLAAQGAVDLGSRAPVRITDASVELSGRVRGIGDPETALVVLHAADAQLNNITILSLNSIQSTRGSLAIRDAELGGNSGQARLQEGVYRRGIAVQALQTPTVIQNVTFTGPGDAIDIERAPLAVRESTFLGLPGTLAIGHVGACEVIARYNDFGNATLGSESACALDARRNWWSTPEGPSNLDRIAGNFEADPWLVVPPDALPRIQAGVEPVGAQELWFTGGATGPRPIERIERLDGQNDVSGPWTTIAQGPNWTDAMPVEHLAPGEVFATYRACDALTCGMEQTLRGYRTPEPLPPVVILEAPLRAVLGETVVLDASRSYSEAGKIVRFHFYGPNLDASPVTGTLAWDPPVGSHLITLTATDARGREASATHVLVVDPISNREASAASPFAALLLIGVVLGVRRWQ